MSPQEFYDRLRRAVRSKVYPTGSTEAGDRFAMKIATVFDHKIKKNRLAGVLAVTTMKLKRAEEGAAAQRNALLPPQGLVETVDNNTRAAYLLLFAVAPAYRRNNIGSQLIHDTLREVVSTAAGMPLENGSTHVVSWTCRAVGRGTEVCCIASSRVCLTPPFDTVFCFPFSQAFVHVPSGERAAEGFFSFHNFVPMGRVPAFFPGDKGKIEATLWATPFHSGELVSYERTPVEKAAGILPDLSKEDVKVAKPRCPRWLSTICLQFGLPIGIVGLLFIISYALVLLGPLRGISGKYIKGEDGVAVDQYVEEEEDTLVEEL